MWAWMKSTLYKNILFCLQNENEFDKTILSKAGKMLVFVSRIKHLESGNLTATQILFSNGHQTGQSLFWETNFIHEFLTYS